MITIRKINGYSKQGIRENNEDYILFKEIRENESPSRIIVLCDGMGGHGHGEVASKTVAETVYNHLKLQNSTEYTSDDLQQALNESLQKLNETDMFDDEKKMGTTLVVAVVNSMNVLVGHVGDSRCYQLDCNSIIKFRTKDHSKVAEAVEAEILTEEEAKHSAYKNILTRCVIAGCDSVTIEVDQLTIEDGDRLLLCTDGMVDAIDDREMQEILMDRSIDESLQIIDTKCAALSHDNYSVIIADLSQDEKNIGPKHLNAKESIQEETSTTFSQPVMRCYQCGSTIPRYSKYCPICGASFNSGQQYVYKEKKKPGKIILYIVVVLVLIVAVVASVRMVHRIREGENNKAQSEQFIKSYKHDIGNYHKEINMLIDQMCVIDKNNNDTVIEKKVLRHKVDSINKKYKQIFIDKKTKTKNSKPGERLPENKSKKTPRK